MTAPGARPLPPQPWPSPVQPRAAAAPVRASATVTATPAATLPASLGPERPLPGLEIAKSRPRHRSRRARHRRTTYGVDALWIPAVSHLPTRETVIRQSRLGAQRVATAVACVSLAGAGILGWDLWGSGWYADRQQSQLAQELEQTPALELPAVPAAAPPADPAAPTVVPQAPPPQILVENVDLADGSAVGRIVIEKIGVDETFVYGTGVEELKKGPGLWKWGVAPGQPGNAMISGHRTTYGAPFHDIDQLAPGDRILIQIPGQTDAVYEVRGTQIVTPEDIQVSDQTGGVRLTMTACHPLGSARERIIVQSELVEGDSAQYALPTDQWTFQS